MMWEVIPVAGAVGSGIPKVVGSGRNRKKITQHCIMF